MLMVIEMRTKLSVSVSVLLPVSCDLTTIVYCNAVGGVVAARPSSALPIYLPSGHQGRFNNVVSSSTSFFCKESKSKAKYV